MTSDLGRRALRLALAQWVNPERVATVVAAALAEGKDPEASDVLTALEDLAAARRPLPTAAEVDAAAERLGRLGGVVHVVGTMEYPRQLQAAWPELGAPLWILVRSADGRLPDAPAAAVVGTRQPTQDGLRTARALGRLLADHGVTVVSGMARGIDQAAHRGALEAGGRTVGVLGTGFGVDYPRGSAELRRDVAAAGGLVTELPPGTPVHARQFLWRNRIISGLADATVVVEGRARSGALQTARMADSQGRHVFAVPGSLNQPTARGPLELIRDGIRCLARFEDVLEILDIPLREHTRTEERALTGLDPDAAAILGLLSAVPVSAGGLAAEADRPVATVLAALGDLTRRGLARATPRGYTTL